MLEVCERFPAIGNRTGDPIDDYMALPPGKRELYDQYTVFKLREEARRVIKF